MHTCRLVYFVLLLGPWITLPARAADPPPSAQPLTATIQALDTALFDAYNQCRLDEFGRLFAANVEFYHDASGVTWDRKTVVENTRQYICGKVRRELVPGTLKVYPVKDFGAIEEGEHRFCEIASGQCVGAARFVMVWRRQADAWQVTRVLSYGHRELSAAELASSADSCVAGMPARIEALRSQHKLRALGVAIIRGGRIVQEEVYGVDAKGQPATRDALFNVASLTKPIVAMTTLRLVERGDWSLDTPLAKDWVDPDIAADPRSKILTTRHVLQHRTGFPNWRQQSPDGRLAFQFDPGAREQYSGEGMEYLRRALEHRFGKSIDALATEVLLAPLSLDATHFVWDDARDPQRIVGGYDADGKAYPIEPRRSALASDDLLTTIHDYATFAAAVLRGGVLAPRMMGELPRGAPGKNDLHMGLGWQIVQGLPESRSAWLHTGADEGVRALVMLTPETGDGLVILSNSDRGGEAYEPLMKACLRDGAAIFERLTRG